MFILVRNPANRTDLRVGSLSGVVNSTSVDTTYPGKGLERSKSATLVQDVEKESGTSGTSGWSQQ
jgi:hypothetical protein